MNISQHTTRTMTQSQNSGARVQGRVGIGEDYYDEQADAIDRDRYYQSVRDSFDDGDGAQLYNDLHRLISRNTRDLGYKGARRELYRTIDRRPDGALYYLYSGEGPKNEEEVTGPNDSQLSNFNCEHVVPQSWFNKARPMKSDLHHLFTEEVKCNSSRANYNMADLPESSRTIPSCGLVNNKSGEFEPNAGKGAVARAVLYFVTRHPGYVGDARVETKLSDLPQLLEWHRDYPVTDYERHRNDTIEDVQGNRNPFIDFPELAEKVDFSRGFDG